jgi:hypothetical protein
MVRDMPNIKRFALPHNRVEKPKCPRHKAEMRFDAESSLWRCDVRNCKVIAKAKTQGDRKVPISFWTVADFREGEVKCAITEDGGCVLYGVTDGKVVKLTVTGHAESMLWEGDELTLTLQFFTAMRELK